MNFCKFVHFINVNKIGHIELKRSGFVKEGVKMYPKVLGGRLKSTIINY